MKKLFFCVLVVLLVSSPAILRAEVLYSLHVEWGYTPPTAPAVKGFKLYREGVPVQEWLGVNTMEGDVVCELFNQVTNFTLTAVFVDGTESPHSSPAAFDRSASRPATPQDFDLLSSLGIPVKSGAKLRMATLVFGANPKG